MANVRTVIGVQARFNPVIKYVRDLIRDGYIGKLLGNSLVGSGMAWGNVTDQANAYILDNSNGVNMLSIPVMHTLYALTYMLGNFRHVSAESSVQQSESLVVETGETVIFIFSMLSVYKLALTLEQMKCSCNEELFATAMK